MTSSVLVLAVLLVTVYADELVMQLSGELRMYPDSTVKARIMRGVISPTPRVNSKGMRYWVQIARDNVVFIPNFGFQTIVPYGRRRLVRIAD
ncbi:hypothetical protein BsWGS_21491 [Bradybaena similaris]